MCDVMLQDICPILSQPYVAHLLRHIYDPNVSDCVLALIYRYVGTEPRELRQERFYQLAGMEFMDRLFGMLDETLVKVPSESLLGIGVTQDGSNYELKLCVQALSELIVRIVRESASTPDGHILFINFMGSPPHALSEFIERVIQGQKLGLDVLHTMITAKYVINSSWNSARLYLT